MKLDRQLLILASALLALSAVECLAQVPGGGFTGGGPSAGDEPAASEPSSPSDLGAKAYQAGVPLLNKAREADGEAANSSDDKKRAKAASKANNFYAKALDKFQDAVNSDPGIVEAWDGIGLCQLHLGNYDDAVMAYSTVLELRPTDNEAYQRRAEANLGQNKTAEAETDYMTLYKAERPRAAELLTYMRRWIEQRQHDPKGISKEDLAAFAMWLDARAADSK